MPFLRSVMENERFNSGKLSTNFIPEEYPEGFKGHPVTPTDIDELIASAAAIHLSRSRRDATISQQLHSRPFTSEYAPHRTAPHTLHRTHRTRVFLQPHTTHDTHRNMDLVVTVEGKNYPITLVQEPTASPAAGAGAPTHPATPAWRRPTSARWSSSRTTARSASGSSTRPSSPPSSKYHRRTPPTAHAHARSLLTSSLCVRVVRAQW